MKLLKGGDRGTPHAATLKGRAALPLLPAPPAPEVRTMKSNVYRLEPPAPAAVAEPEPIEAAVRELSARIAENNEARRRLYSRLDELRGLSSGLRRKRVRPLPPEMTAPVTFYSIEEADAEEAPAALQVA